MRLLHPFMPFLTEQIWQTLPHKGESIVIQPYPSPDAAWSSSDMEQRFTLLEHAVSLVRTARVLLNYPPGQQVPFAVTHDDPVRRAQLVELRPHLVHLGRGTADLAPISSPQHQRVLLLVTEGLSVGIAVAADVDVQKALDRIVRQQEEQKKEIARLEGKLGNQEFSARAPAEVIVDHHERLKSLRGDQAMLASSESQLRAMLGT
jgi:valyl-tRNA synthetase